MPRELKLFKSALTLLLVIYFSISASASCGLNEKQKVITSIENLTGPALGFPLDTVLVNLSDIPPDGNMSDFNRAYARAIAYAAKEIGMDLSRIIVPLLPYGTAQAPSYSEVSQRYSSPASVLVDTSGNEALLVSLSSARLLELAGGKSNNCDTPLVVDTAMLNYLAGKWGSEVLPQNSNRAVRRFTAALPQHLTYLTALFKNAGGGGFAPFSSSMFPYLEQCLWESLPYLEAVLIMTLSKPNPSKSLSVLASELPSELIALRPRCLKN